MYSLDLLSRIRQRGGLFVTVLYTVLYYFLFCQGLTTLTLLSVIDMGLLGSITSLPNQYTYEVIIMGVGGLGSLRLEAWSVYLSILSRLNRALELITDCFF